LRQELRFFEQLQRFGVLALVERELAQIVQAFDDAERIRQLATNLERRFERLARLRLLPVIPPN